MPRRRTFGSARQLPSNRWQAAYWHDGKLISAGTFDSKADAHAALSEAETAVRAGRWLDPSAGQETFRSFSDRWLAQRNDLRPTTRAKYSGLLQRHLVPTFGDRALASLTPSAIRQWYHALAKVKPATADDSYRLLRAILNTAVSDEMIARNPCQVRGAGQVRSAERPVASIAEVAAGAAAMPDRLQLAVLLAAWCQLRRGEILGLQRRDVDLEAGTIRIERSWTSSDGLRLGPPKTEAGLRVLSVPGNVVPMLRSHLAEHVDPGPEAWLFPASRDRSMPLRPLDLNRAWVKARRLIGREDLHVHDLRHSGLTFAAATGASVAELMRRGGHSNPAAALRYQHATDDRDRVLADALAALVSGPSRT